ncbi:MAG TPA: methylmalonyl Co-A mutase-associated GTPase MeaB [Egibacteraceae bacterium]|nr:methylmalonyl Co-A mutase-associated GTPase MeaB [Egibacteraceae bacterium]
MGADDLVDRLRAGDRRAVARLLTLVEDGSPDHLREAIAALHPHTGRAHIVGITGSPGVGKSTLTNAMVAEWRRRDRTVGVVAVDPSSPFSGGALLGDRVRMQEHVLDDGVFVRSMASRGHLGGLSWATPQAVLVLDAAGFDFVVVETVGVGQAELEVASTADTTVVTVAPGMGDAIQAAKAGIFEVADVFCVNKADREGVDRTVRELKEMQMLGAEGESGWLPPIWPTVASRAEGVAELVDALDAHHAWLLDSGRRDQLRLERARLQVRELALGTLRARFAEWEGGDLVDDLSRRVALRELDPYTAADRLVATVSG